MRCCVSIRSLVFAVCFVWRLFLDNIETTRHVIFSCNPLMHKGFRLIYGQETV